MTTLEGLFAQRDPGLIVWPDPHPDRSPLQEEYSRVTDPARWRLLGARADAWVGALAAHGLSQVKPIYPDQIEWQEAPGPLLTSAVLVQPTAPGALPLVVARSRIDDIPDAGVTLGIGHPAVCVGWFPDCGCDACDTGGADELAHLDQYLRGVVTGQYRRLTRDGEVIVALGDTEFSSTGMSERDQVAAVLADPRGWEELSGGSWLGEQPAGRAFAPTTVWGWRYGRKA